ncbi:hypothetical protein HN652_01045 [archaeon]|jgi:hypothetical protein|nr:hypothetical protein [archaeon]MBT6868922.1 hypothetical protein [archaeon]MBT7192857.1 hypothetical protein [archaeon]MBT7380823.1 hypothetical protein [archaeon]MBT7507578.1 hypothetical protein [archaeon]
MGLFNHSANTLNAKLTGAIEICDIIIKHKRNNPNLDTNNLKKAIKILKQYLIIISDSFRQRKEEEKSNTILNHIITCDKLVDKISLPKNEVITKIDKIKVTLRRLSEDIKLTTRKHKDILKNNFEKTNFTQSLDNDYGHYSSVLIKIGKIKELLNQLIEESQSSNNHELIKHKSHIKKLEIEIERIRADILKSKSKGNSTIAA